MSLYQQLLDRLAAVAGPPSYPRLGAALRVAVKMHKPVESWCAARTNENGEWEERAVEVDGQVVALDGINLMCFAEKVPTDWPCATVQAIARELGIQEFSHG